MDSDTGKPKKKTKQKQNGNAVNVRWIATISITSFLLSVLMSYTSKRALESVGNIIAFVILLVFISIGILFDIIGVASTVATEKRFHSMAARRVNGAKQAIWIVRNAEKVGSFCNDECCYYYAADAGWNRRALCHPVIGYYGLCVVADNWRQGHWQDIRDFPQRGHRVSHRPCAVNPAVEKINKMPQEQFRGILLEFGVKRWKSRKRRCDMVFWIGTICPRCWDH